MKKCPSCNTTKDNEAFNKGRGIDGLASYCRDCSKKRHKEWYHKKKVDSGVKTRVYNKLKKIGDDYFKSCARCETEKKVDEFPKNGAYFNSYCKECHRENHKDRLKQDGFSEHRYYVEVKRKYNLTKEQLDTMWDEQDGKCEVCEKEMDWTAKSKNRVGSDTMHIDHCHETGFVRGLLCQECNTELGKVEKLLRDGRLIKMQCYLADSEQKYVLS